MSSAAAFGNLCRDGIHGNYIVKGVKVIDQDTNLKCKNSKMNGDTRVNKNLTVCGEIIVKGSIIFE